MLWKSGGAPGCVCWAKRWRRPRWRGGWASVPPPSASGTPAAAPGPPAPGNAAHKEQLRRALRRGAQAHGFVNELWTLPRIAAVLQATCGVRLHPGHLWRVLGALGWSVQKPERRAFQRDEAAITRWKEHTWPALKKSPAGAAHPCLHLMKAG